MLVYFYFNQDLQPETIPTGEETEQQIPENIAEPENIDTVMVPEEPDSLELARRQNEFGDMAGAMQGEEREVVLENQVIKVTLSSKGGMVKEVLLKNYQTFDKQPLVLMDESSTEMFFMLNLNDREVNLSDLYYMPGETSSNGDSSSVQFHLSLPDGKQIIHHYTLGSGYQLHYALKTPGLETTDPTQMARFEWIDRLKKLERELDQSRSRSSVNYFLADGTFDDVGDNSNDLEEEIITEPIQWVTMNQKFFSAGFIAEKPIRGAALSTVVPDEQDTSVVKVLKMTLNIPQENFSNSGFTFYFGPNDYQLTKKVTDGFHKNVYLGWSVFAWINKWLIIPVFNFLENYISNYGIIIIILAIFIKLILSPISYKSYLSMAKMKVLKPQLDEIREKHGDDMQKAQAAQMQLYGKVGVNPLSGCIPMLLQMPILLAMFNFFPNSIDLRQEQFLWADDLSSYDSILSLPFNIPFYGDHVSLFTLLMAGSTMLYTWSNQQMQASMQGPMKTMQYLMPIMMIFFFNSFSSGLTFYYFVLNILNFGQQAIIKKYFIDEEKILRIMEENKLRNKNKKKSKFQQRLEEAMKAAEESKKNRK